MNMILQIPSVYPSDYMKSLDFPLWILQVVVGLIGFIIFLYRIKKSTVHVQRSIYLGMGIFLLFLSAMRTSYILSVRLQNGDFYSFFTSLGYSLGLAGIGGFLFGIERSVIKKTRYILTIISFIGVALGLLSVFKVISQETALPFTYAIDMIATALMIILYIWLSFKSTGIIRRRTFIGIFAVLFIFLGVMLDSEAVYGIFPAMPVILPPIFAVIGIILIIYVQRY